MQPAGVAPMMAGGGGAAKGSKVSQRKLNAPLWCVLYAAMCSHTAAHTVSRTHTMALPVQCCRPTHQAGARG